jgi:hypothetical protein
LVQRVKVTYSQKFFHFCSNLFKNVPNHDPDLHPTKKKTVCHIFREIKTNLKNFLRLIHL